MKIQHINMLDFKSGSALLDAGTKTSKNLIKFPKVKNSHIQKQNMLQRASLQKNSILKPLRYLDDDFDFADYCYRKDTGYRNCEQEARDTVIGMTMLNGFTGGVTAQFLGINAGAAAGVIGIMVTKIATIYGIKLTDAVFNALKEGFKGSLYVGFTSKFIGIIPIIGNIINGATDAYITQKIGFQLIDTFEKANQKVVREMELYEGINKILDENEKLRKRNELINKALAELAEEERKKNSNK